MIRFSLLLAFLISSCSSAPVKWPDRCDPSLNGQISCRCDNLQYVREKHPTKPSPAFRQTIVCDGVPLPIEALADR